MSKLLTNERIFILKTLGWGLLINCLVCFLSASKINTLIDSVLPIIMLVFVYFLLPYITCHTRHLLIKNSKYFNMEGEDVTARVPQHRYFFIHIISFMVLSYFLFKLFHQMRYFSIFSDECIGGLFKDSLMVSAPLIVIYTYFFIKNLPVATYLLFVSNGISSNTYQSSHIKYIHYPTSSTWQNDPSRSSLSGNRYHKN